MTLCEYAPATGKMTCTTSEEVPKKFAKCIQPDSKKNMQKQLLNHISYQATKTSNFPRK